MPQADFEKLLTETLAAHGRSPRTQETYVLMLRLFGRYLDQRQTGRTVDTRKDLDRCRELIGSAQATPREKEASWVAAFERLFGVNPLACPACKIGTMIVREVVAPMRR